MTDKVLGKPICGHGTEVGSYPGGRYLVCHKPEGHDGDHEATVWWERRWPECDGCKPQESGD